MSQSFAESAQRLAGLAARALGWRPHEFWAATPAELALSLAPPERADTPLDRAGLNRLMEQPDG